MTLREQFDKKHCQEFTLRRLNNLGSWTDRDEGKSALAAAVFAIKSGYFLGLDLQPFREKFLNLIESFRDKDNWYHDSHITSQEHLLGETRQTLSVVKKLDAQDLPSPKIDFPEYVGSLNSGNPWSFNANISHLMFFAQFEKNEKALSFLLNTIEKYRNSDGLWGSRAISPSSRINGAMKAIVAYRLLNQKINHMDKILKYTLKHQGKVKDGCHECDLAVVLNECLPETRWLTKSRSLKLANKLLNDISIRQREDGGFSFYEDHCQTEFYGTSISEPLPISDIHGTHLYLWALSELQETQVHPSYELKPTIF